jgi:uncharacterized protein (TIGR00251 family)
LPRLSVIVSAGASRSEIVGRHGDGWKVRLASPPERGRANEALLGLLAEALAVPRADISIVRGRTARLKIVEVTGLDADDVGRRLEAAARNV